MSAIEMTDFEDHRVRSIISYFHRAGHGCNGLSVTPKEEGEKAGKIYVRNMYRQLKQREVETESVQISCRVETNGRVNININPLTPKAHAVAVELFPPTRSPYSKSSLLRQGVKIKIIVNPLPMTPEPSAIEPPPRMRRKIVKSSPSKAAATPAPMLI